MALNTLSHLGVTMLTLLSVATCLPTDTGITKRETDCWTLDKLTIEYLYNNNCYDPLPSTCLFYTEYQSNNARVFSHRDSAHLTTIWEMWDFEYYDDSRDLDNAMRCIMADGANRLTYFQRMSTAMALKCDVFSTMMSGSDIDNVPKSGIWYNQEYPTLMRTSADNKAAFPWLPSDYANQVNSIDYIMGPDGDNNQVYWMRGDANPRRDIDDALPGRNASQEIRRRASCGAGSDAASTFDVGGALPVKW